MYQSFRVQNFRCLRDLDLANLARVNLITGMNNVGKTALLEALFLHCGAYNPALTLTLNAFRGIESVKVELGPWAATPWDSLFSDFDTSNVVELIGEDDITGHRIVKLKVLHEPEELAKIRQPAQYESAPPPEIPSTTQFAQVLKLEYADSKSCRGSYLVLDARGARTQPIPPPPPFPTFFLGTRARIPFREQAERYGRLQRQGEEDRLCEVLKLIDPRLTRLALVIEGGEPILHADIGAAGRRLMPLPVMGEGMVRLADFVLHISNAENGVVLIDEIENGLHHSVLCKVWQAIGKVARQFKAQVFATTHSFECIVAAHRAFSNNFLENGIYDFRLHRLDRVDDTIRAVTYDQELLEAAIETELEVR